MLVLTCTLNDSTKREKDTPTCRPNQRDLFGVAREEVVNITCEVDSDPQDVTFRWTLNNSVENTELHTFESSGAMSVLTYTPKTPMDYGAVQCLGRNSVGEQKEPCVVRIIPAGLRYVDHKGQLNSMKFFMFPKSIFLNTNTVTRSMTLLSTHWYWHWHKSSASRDLLGY
ncbi:ig-like domain-containing protein [Trichonephila inaurata madagascariensis]|uniref:Ig-like domain-containing protein n=1 Tax=Trichonephila inaurata madagascariensis TaxID=2747483 RepID=A0A8X6YCM3_9ARAC|nr:ig-like domain-containing protein [Trichonephila inaurata madagascariensis]